MNQNKSFLLQVVFLGHLSQRWNLSNTKTETSSEREHGQTEPWGYSRTVVAPWLVPAVSPVSISCSCCPSRDRSGRQAAQISALRKPRRGGEPSKRPYLKLLKLKDSHASSFLEISVMSPQQIHKSTVIMFFPTQPTWICFFLRFKMASF
jgi:hypothetical protein